MISGIFFAFKSRGKRLTQIILISVEINLKDDVLRSRVLPWYHLNLHLRDITSILGLRRDPARIIVIQRVTVVQAYTNDGDWYLLQRWSRPFS
jgi:hypothetical protein